MNKPPYIALVDDDRQLVKFLKQALEEGGYEVTATTSSKQMLSQLEVRLPDLLILDLNMPEPDGFDLLKTVRAAYPYLRMIVISGFLKGSLLEAARFVGAVATLEKPVSADALVTKVREVLGDPEPAAKTRGKMLRKHK
jgi:DNA-binding NtrC family response regulator